MGRSDNLCRIASVEYPQKNEQAQTKRYIEPAGEQGTNEFEWYIALSLLADALFSGIRRAGGKETLWFARHANVTERTTNDDKDRLSIMMMTIVTM